MKEWCDLITLLVRGVQFSEKTLHVLGQFYISFVTGPVRGIALWDTVYRRDIRNNMTVYIPNIARHTNKLFSCVYVHLHLKSRLIIPFTKKLCTHSYLD